MYIYLTLLPDLGCLCSEGCFNGQCAEGANCKIQTESAFVSIFRAPTVPLLI